MKATNGLFILLLITLLYSCDDVSNKVKDSKKVSKAIIMISNVPKFLAGADSDIVCCDSCINESQLFVDSIDEVLNHFEDEKRSCRDAGYQYIDHVLGTVKYNDGGESSVDFWENLFFNDSIKSIYNDCETTINELPKYIKLVKRKMYELYNSPIYPNKIEASLSDYLNNSDSNYPQYVEDFLISFQDEDYRNKIIYNDIKVSKIEGDNYLVDVETNLGKYTMVYNEKLDRVIKISILN